MYSLRFSISHPVIDFPNLVWMKSLHCYRILLEMLSFKSNFLSSYVRMLNSTCYLSILIQLSLRLKMADSGENETKKRNCYRREFKLKVMQWYYDQGGNVAHTAKKFHVDRKQIREWIKKERQIQESKKRCQKIKSRRTALFPNAETELHE